MLRSTPRMPRLLGACILALGLTPLASAVPFAWYDVDASGELIGSRTDNGGGLVAANALEGTSISWNIVDNGNGTWTYTYTFPTVDSPSHFILELSQSCIDDDELVEGCITGFTGKMEFSDAWGAGPSNPSFPVGQTINGVKFDVELGTYTFTSDRNPVYGSFYIKKASDGYAYNEGLALGPGHLSETPLPWIVRPNGGKEPPSEIPEPGTLALLGAGLVGLGVFHKIRRK